MAYHASSSSLPRAGYRRQSVILTCTYLFVFDRRALRLVGVLVDPSSIWSRPILCTRSPPFVLRGILAAQSTSVSYSSSLFSAVASPRRSKPSCARKTPCPERSAGILRSASLRRARTRPSVRGVSSRHAPQSLGPLGQPATSKLTRQRDGPIIWRDSWPWIPRAIHV